MKNNVEENALSKNVFKATSFSTLMYLPVFSAENQDIYGSVFFTILLIIWWNNKYLFIPVYNYGLYIKVWWAIVTVINTLFFVFFWVYECPKDGANIICERARDFSVVFFVAYGFVFVFYTCFMSKNETRSS